MIIESKQEKIEFLEKILKIAKENSQVINKGVEIFDADSHHVREECNLFVKLDNKGNPYFAIRGTYSKNSERINDPETLLFAGDRYLPNNLDKFKGKFHLYKDYTNQISENDLINSLRN